MNLSSLNLAILIVFLYAANIMITKVFLKVSEARKKQIIGEITSGSEPGFRFYALLSTSSLIAAFGLILDSTAIIIGAMLVSPLMTPIIGITMGIVIGKPRLLGSALRSVIIGIALAIFFASLIGFLPLELTATSEMLSRTKPTLLDLIVAVLAGFAGAYAMIDEKLSPALPGVAIAVAIVPPLSNTGICLSLGYFDGAFGSFMLFFANFLSILIVAGATFIFAGLNPWWISISTKDLVQRFGLAILGFLAVSVFLTYSLVGIVEERQLENTIKHILDSAIIEFHATSLDSFIYDQEDGKLYVLANIKSPRIINPYMVEDVQKKIEEQTKRPTELIFRNVLAQDIGSLGSEENIIRQNLDGSFIKETLSDWKKAVNIIEKELMEMLAHWPGMSVVDVDYAELPRGPTVIATMQGYRNLTQGEIEELQNRLRTKMDNPNINVIMKNEQITYSDTSGELIPGYIYGGLTDEQKIIRDEIESAIMKEFTQYNDIIAIGIHHRPETESWDVLVEAVGVSALNPGEIGILEEDISNKLDRNINIDIWYKTDTVITNKGYIPFKEFNANNVKELDEYFEGMKE